MVSVEMGIMRLNGSLGSELGFLVSRSTKI